MYKRELTNRQEEIYELIKSLHDSGLGYRRITKRLRDMKSKQLMEEYLRIITYSQSLRGTKSDRYVLEKNVIESMSINGEKCI